VTWLANVPAFVRARSVVRRRTQGVWERDRTTLSAPAALGNRVARIVIMATRGLLQHRLGVQSAALTYFTVFAIVPLLVVVLWTLKAVHHLPAISPELPEHVTVPTGNQMLHAALGQILEAVDRTSEVTSGVVGLAVLLFAVSKLFSFTERALHVIAESGQRMPRPWRALGYVALLFVAPTAVAVSGVLLALVHGARGTLGVRVLDNLPYLPNLRLAIGVAVGFAALWLVVTLLYFGAVRARIPFASAAVGAVLVAVALLVIFWVFATFQIGAAKASALSSGFLAFPVFLLLVFSSWYAVLVGAEIAVAHHVDRVLPHGAVTFHLDNAGERQTAVALMERLTERAAGGVAHVPADELAGELRLPPHLVRELGFRLERRGLVASSPRGFALACDPSVTAASRITDAVDRDPTLGGSRWHAPLEDVTLQELVDRRQNEPPPAALNTSP
jgi:YihY family inner membrane protein